MEVLIEEILIYGVVIASIALIVIVYMRKLKKISDTTAEKIAKAKEEGRYEPVSLHPYIDLSTCIGSGACITSCPEKDILGIVHGKAEVINASSCVGHGACFHNCPVEAISLRIGTESRGVELPHVNLTFETNISGIYIAGELGGMGLIKNSVEQGKQAIDNINKSLHQKGGENLDLIIIGAGPAGISAALTAKSYGLTFKVLEQDTLGGTVYSFPRAKIVMTNPMKLPLYKKVKLYDTSKDELLSIWNEALSNNNITINEHCKVDHIIPVEGQLFKTKCNDGKEFISKRVLIAIGRRGSPRKLNIPGEELPKVYYRLLEPERFNDKKIIVVGGGDSAIESALLLMEENDVTLSYRKDHFARLKPKNRERIEEAYDNKKVNILFNSNLVKITSTKAHFKINNLDEIKIIENDLVYVFIGGELPIKFLQEAGVEIKKRFGQVVKSYGHS